MATMTLRVGGKKSNKSNFHSDCQQFQCVNISPSILGEARNLNGDTGGWFSNQVNQLADSKSVEEQVRILKLISDLYFSDNSELVQFTSVFLKLLAQLYLKSELKNPVKFAATRFLLRFPDAQQSKVAHCLADGLVKLMNVCDLTEANNVANTVAGCFDNFPPGTQAISLCFPDTIFFLEKMMSECLKLLNNEDVSPTTRMKFFTYAHSCTRATVSVMQKWHSIINTWLHEDTVAESTIPQQRRTEILSNMKESATLLISLPDVPMDTKSNCGIIIVTVTMLTEGESSWKNLLVLPENLEQNDMHILSISTGLLNVVPPEHLCSYLHSGNEVALRVIFWNLQSIVKRNPSDPTTVLATGRAFQLLSRNLHICCQLNVVAVVSVLNDILQHFLELIWINLEHYMDSVRHTARGTLQYLLRAAKCAADTDGSLGETIRTTILKTPSNRKYKYLALAVLAEEMGTSLILECCPNLPKDILDAVHCPTVAAHAVAAYESLMGNHKTETDNVNWCQNWIQPILFALKSAQCTTYLSQLLETALGMNSQNTDNIIEWVRSDLRSLLVCLRVAHKKFALDGNNDDSSLWRGAVDIEILERAIVHPDEEIRVSCLALIVETRRSTEPFTEVELKLLCTFMRYNINAQEPSFRQQFMALIKKALIRLKSSSQFIKKSIASAEKKGEQNTRLQQLLDAANNFLLWLVESSFASLFPGANFGRRGCALQILTMCYSTLGTDTPETFWTPANADTLLECLKDSFENNKELACRLLTKFPAASVRLDGTEHVKSLLRVCLTLVASARPPDCLTAAYLLATISSFNHAKAVTDSVVQIFQEYNYNYVEGSVGNENYCLLYSIVLLLKTHLDVQVKRASVNLLSAAANGPMYGSLFAIRHLLRDVDLSVIAKFQEWKNVVQELVSICFDACRSVAPVVNCSSPEGHLPMDFQSGKSVLIDVANSEKTALELLKDMSISSAIKEKEEEEKCGDVTVTAQMLLLCSWRTVKETSLFLGDIAARAPISDNSEEGLLSEEQLLKIGEHLSALLSETKHRGAFEQAYLGYCQLCQRLWSVSSDLHKLPKIWLNDLLNAIAGGGDSPFSATRRSAGLPFMVQALVTSETQSAGSAHSFHSCMKKLLEITQDPTAPPEAQSHALNILRALFRHTQLGEVVTPYVSPGVEAALRAFRSNFWGVRNSGTLLFSSLMTRIFGVQRERYTTSTRNRMTGRIFFQRFPQLYDVLIEELKAGADEPFPALLLLLARLYPSSLEGTDSSLQLSAFIPYIRASASSTVYKTRVLAAEALVPLVTPDMFQSTLQLLFKQLKSTEPFDYNTQHGVLLQIVMLLKEMPGALQCNSNFIAGLEGWVSETLCPNHFVVAEAWIQLIRVVRLQRPEALSLNTRNRIANKLWNDFNQKNIPIWFIGKALYEKQASKLLLELDCDYSTESILELLLTHSSYEVVEVALHFILSMFGYCDPGKDSTKKFSVGGLPDSVSKVKPLAKSILSITSKNEPAFSECRRLALIVLKYVPNVAVSDRTNLDWEIVSKLLLILQHEQEEIAVAALQACTAVFIHLLPFLEINEHITCQLFEYFLEYSGDSHALESRQIVAKLLVEYKNILLFSSHPKNKLPTEAICCIWTAAVSLLEDDDASVRNLASAVSDTEVIPTKCRELLLDRLLYESQLHASELAALLIAWALGNCENDDFELEDCVFEASEANTFAEGATLCELACGHLWKATEAEHSLLNEALKPNFKKWLCSQCSISSDESNFSTVGEFLKFATCSSFLKKNNCDVGGTEHFLAPPGQGAAFLSVYRILCLQEVVKTLSEKNFL